MRSEVWNGIEYWVFPKLRTDAYLRRVAASAAQAGGRVTETYLVKQSGFDPDMLKLALRRLVENGEAHLETEDGITHFVFSPGGPRRPIRRCSYCGGRFVTAPDDLRCANCGAPLSR